MPPWPLTTGLLWLSTPVLTSSSLAAILLERQPLLATWTRHPRLPTLAPPPSLKQGQSILGTWGGLILDRLVTGPKEVKQQVLPPREHV